MNSFSTLNTSNLHNLPPYTSLPNFNFVKTSINIPPLEMPNLNTLSVVSPVNSLHRQFNLHTIPSLNNQSTLRDTLSPISQELSNMLLSWKLQQNLQAEILKAQMDQIAELKNSLLGKLNQVQLQADRTAPEALVAKEANNENGKVKTEVPQGDKKTLNLTPKKKDLRGQIRDIVEFVLDNFGRINEDCFNDEKLRYSDNKQLMMVFDLLTAKYSSTIKTKEEMVKYTLRRAFKFIKSHIRKHNNTNTKGVSKALCNKYFNASQDDISKIGNEEDFLKSVLPFRKNSRNKTMNTSFIGEVFSSENFAKDYDLYLQNFDAILDADNTNKIDRLIEFIEDCIKADKIQDIKKYKRIPWPKLWIANTKKIAQDLPAIGAQGNLDSPHNLSKKVKLEESLTSNMKDNDCDSQVSTSSSH